MNTRDYQQRSVARTQRWAARCLGEHRRLTGAGKPPHNQALFAVVQGAQYEDLRRQAARDLVSLVLDGSGFDGYGIGGALEKESLGTIVRWVCEELPEDKARHLLGISEPDDIFTAIENGVDTFDCVAPSRVARNAAVYTVRGRFNVNTATSRRNFSPIDQDCDCYTCARYTQAYLHHLFKAREMLASTLCTIHNERFVVRLVDDIRASIEAGTFSDFKIDFLSRYYGSPLPCE
jgi:queuine tRNA-ribosyltransferase